MHRQLVTEVLKIKWTNSLHMKEPVSLRKAAGDIFQGGELNASV